MRQSQQLFDQAKTLMPGGVNSPVRSFDALGGQPIFIKRGQGAYIYDEDGNQYIDYVGSWGAMILGHAHPQIIQTVQQIATSGLSFGANHWLEIAMAKKVLSIIPKLEMIRFVNSGTEASMTAIRLARGYTGRNKIIKFKGCYHGHEDCLLAKAGSGVTTLGLPDSAGIPTSTTKNTLVANFNNLGQVEQLFVDHGNAIAAIIVEAVAGNAGCLSPCLGFLSGLKTLCNRYHSLLIIDEVMTGFRVALGGAQQKYGVVADITIFGKIIGGGLPVGAVAASREIIMNLAPTGPIYQAGTFSGNPMTMAAGLKTLEVITADDNFHQKITEKTTHIVNGIVTIARKLGIPLHGNVEGGMFGLWFSDHKITHYDDIKNSCNHKRFARFFHAMLKQGVYLPPSPFESCFTSIAHDEEIIEKTLQAAKKALQNIKR